MCGLLEELGRNGKGVGLRNVLLVGLVRIPLKMFFLSVHHTIPKDKFFGLYEARSYSGSIQSFYSWQQFR